MAKITENTAPDRASISNALFAELTDWVVYTEARARGLDKLADENKPYPDAHARLETKAGDYRSLATEVKRILKANEAGCPDSRGEEPATSP